MQSTRAKKHVVICRAYDKRHRLIARASNSYSKTHPLQAHYARLAGMPKRIYLHAEIACLLRAGTRKVYSLEVERYDFDGNPALSKPCPVCSLAIKHWGVKYVEYTK